jgi:general L-amino acid transport system substrate-binding protein
MKSRWWRVLAALLALALVAAACSDDSDDGDDGGGTDETTSDTSGDGGGGDEAGLLDTVRERGVLECGGNDTLPGFGIVDDAGEFAGFDIDYCRAIAAGILGDADAVNITPLTAEQRFTALQSGDIDVLVRNTTWTASRDGTEGVTFLHTTYYDGQGMMVPADSEFEDIDSMDGASICVLSGTTTELNLASRATAANITLTPNTFESNDELNPAYLSGACDGWTSDRSQLAGFKAQIEGEGGPEQRVLDEIISKEPLGPAVRDGDSEWAQAVDWIVLATIQAEEFGLDSTNIESYDGDDPDTLRFIGAEDPVEETVLDPGLGLDTDFAVNVVSQVGNYGEIFERNVGADSPLGLVRGLNAQWTDGGLIYAPPYR